MGDRASDERGSAFSADLRRLQATGLYWPYQAVSSAGVHGLMDKEQNWQGGEFDGLFRRKNRS